MNKAVTAFLKKIRIYGVAGVDHPAHQHEGWALVKSSTDHDEFESELVATYVTAVRLKEQHDALAAALDQSHDYLAVLPADAQQAASTVRNWLRQTVTA